MKTESTDSFITNCVLIGGGEPVLEVGTALPGTNKQYLQVHDALIMSKAHPKYKEVLKLLVNN